MQNFKNTKDHPIYQEVLRESTIVKLLTGGMNPSDVEDILRKLMLSDGIEPTQELIDEAMSTARSDMQKGQKVDIQGAVRHYIDLTDGHFFITDTLQFVTDYYKDLHGITNLTGITRNAITVALHREKNKGVIEKIGSKNGEYRKVSRETNEIDIFAVDAHPLSISWPFRIQDLVHIYPKSIIVIAGEPNAGKTAMALNVAVKNCDKFPVTYFSSEMGAIELRQRIEKFNLHMDIWRKIRFIERASDFADVINPEGFNIIDFLEIHDNFYVIGGLMKQIFDKLTTGVALILIQKNKGRDSGLGGYRGLEKPRLYLSMCPGMLKIIKAKNWVSDMTNPNGLQITFKLAAGCKFVKDGEWHRGE